ncbi:PaaI family thioesterase [Streptomyces sp. NPDC096934]|uniref:PaaI family thioesterase n=1 Tax=Streptomyces sp. NPDC096934 TaxID=3155551 RepID=UPI00332E346C
MRRTREYSWENPETSAATLGRTSGLSFLRDMMTGRIPGPPISAALGFTLVEVESGRAVFTMKPGEEHYNPIGSVHGGVFATLLDSAAGCAVHSALPAQTGYTSLDLNVKFIRPITIDTGEIYAVGTILNQGRRTVLAQAQLFSAEQKLLAHATSSCMIFPVPAHQISASR